MTGKNSKHKRSLFVYLIIANGFTWLCWIPGLVIGGRNGYILPNFDTYKTLFETGWENTQHMLLGILFLLGVYGPLIGALAATWMEAGKEGLAELWQRMTKWQVGGRWYLIVLLVTFLLAGVPVLVFGLVGGYTPSAFGLAYMLFVFVIQLFTSGLGEEPGWRGFLLPRLKAGSTNENHIWWVGLIWAVWHYPLVILQTVYGMPDLTTLQILVTVLTSLAGFTMSIIGMTYLYNWLYAETGSGLLMIVFHALSNIFSFWLPTFLQEPEASTLFVALMPWAFVIVLPKILGKERFLGIETFVGES